MSLNFKLLEQKFVSKSVSENDRWEMQYVKDENKLHFFVSKSHKKLDDDIGINLDFYENDIFTIKFVLDELEINEDRLKLINYFNNKNLYLTAYVNEENLYLEIRYTACVIDEDDAVNKVFYIIHYFFNDAIVEYLKPLTILTI